MGSLHCNENPLACHGARAVVFENAFGPAESIAIREPFHPTTMRHPSCSKARCPLSAQGATIINLGRAPCFG